MGSRTQWAKQPCELFCERWPKLFAKHFIKLNPKCWAKSKNDSPRIHQNNKKAYASAPFVILRDLIKGVERSEQNNPVSCFVNGDRSFLRDATKNQIQSIEQKARTTPLGSHWWEHPRGACDTNRGSHSALEDRQARLSDAECRNIRQRRNSPNLQAFLWGVERSEQNNPVSCFANGDRSFLRDAKEYHWIY